MSDDFAKFLFLGAMILIVLVSNRGAIYEEAENFSGARLSAVAAGSVAVEPPLFILELPAGRLSQEERGDEREERKEQKKEEGVAPIAVTPPVLFENAPISGEKLRIAQGGDVSAPSIAAASALVADPVGGMIFFGFSAERRWPVASITKLVSAAVVSKNFPMHEAIALTTGDFLAQSPENGLKEGEKYSIQDLMAAMLLESSNQAAEALARFWGRDRFVQAMNQLANEWGLGETHFDDPTGLSASNQSTAKDLLRLTKDIYEKYPEIFRITRQESAALTELYSGRKVIIRNINLFSGKDYFIGGKTGYTDEAGGNLLSVFNHDSKPVFIVVLGSNDRFGETERLFEWFKSNR